MQCFDAESSKSQKVKNAQTPKTQFCNSPAGTYQHRQASQHFNTEGWALGHRCKAKTVEGAAYNSERGSTTKFQKNAFGNMGMWSPFYAGTSGKAETLAHCCVVNTLHFPADCILNTTHRKAKQKLENNFVLTLLLKAG